MREQRPKRAAASRFVATAERSRWRHGGVVAQRLLVASGKATRLLEQAEGALDLRARLVPFLVVGQLLRAAAVRGNDGDAVLRGERRSKRIRVVGLVAEQTRGQHSGNKLSGRLIVVPLALGDLEREGQSERIDDYVDLRGETTARATDALLCGPAFPPAACW